MGIPRKTGMVVCYHCKLPCKNEIVSVSHRFLGRPTDSTLEFCGTECFREYFFDREYGEKVDEARNEIRKEFIKGLCPACIRRNS